MNTRLIGFAAAALIALFSGITRAATYTWTQTAAGQFLWTSGANWNPSSGYPDAVGDVADFGVNVAGTQTVWLPGVFTLGSLTIGDTTSPWNSITISSTNGGSLVMDVTTGSATITNNTATDLASDTIAANILLRDDLFVTNSATGGAIILSGSIGGSGYGLTKAGVGTLILSGNNGYTGATTINAGILQIGSGSTSGSLSTSSAIGGSEGGTLAFSRSDTVTQGTHFASVIGGAINLTQLGSGTLILNGANTYTGTTTVTGGGMLQIGANGATGSISASSPLVLGGAWGGGTVNLNRSGAVTQAFAGTTLNPGASAATANATNAIDFGAIARNVGSTLNIAATGTFVTSSANTNGILGGGIVYGGTTWAVSGTTTPITGLAAGSYTTTATVGTTAASYASANIDATSSAGTLSGAITPNSLRFHSAAANTVTLAASGVSTVQNGILVTSAVGNNASTITGGSIAGSSGGDLVVVQNNTSNSLTISSTVVNNGSATALTKSGAGNLTLSSSNSYSGGTYLNSGTLTLGNNYALGTGTLTINGGRLAVNNSILSNNPIVANASFSISGANNLNTGTGAFRISQPITISGGADNNPFQGVVISNVIADMNGGNTLNAFDVTWFNGSSTTGLTLSGSTITLRDNQRANFLGLTQITAGYNINSNIVDAGNGYGLTFVNGGAVNPGTAGYNRGPGVFLVGTNSYTGPTVLEPGAVVNLGRNGTVGSLSPSSAIINDGVLALYRSNTITQGTDFGTISGVGQLVQSGGGTTILTATNTYTGATLVTGGVLQIGNSGTTGSLATQGIGGSATLAFRRTDTVTQGTDFGSIFGTLTVRQLGSGTLVLSRVNTHTNVTSSGTGGTIRLDTNNALQWSAIETGSTGVYALGAGVTTPVIGGLTGSRNLSAVVTGNYSQMTSLTLNPQSGTPTYSGTISGNLNLVKWGAGTQILSGSNTFTGTTFLNAGTLQFNDGGAVSPTSPIVLNAGVLQVNRSNTMTQGIDFGTISGAGSFTQSGGGTTILTATNTGLVVTTISAGNVRVGNGGTTGSLPVGGLIVNNATLSFNRSNDVGQGTDFSSQPIVGTGGLTKQGGGNLTLNAANLFTGNTVISAGKIVLGTASALQNSAYDTTGSTGAIGLDVSTNSITKPTLGGLVGSVNVATAITGYSGITELILNPQSGKTVSYAGVIADGAIGMNLTKAGAGTQTLTGSSTYTGTTTVLVGTLTLNRQTGTLVSTSPLTLSGAGGTFNVDNTGASASLSQNLGTLTFEAADGTVRQTRTASQDQVLTFSSLAARGKGATGNFSLSGGSPSATNGFVLTGQATGALVDPGIYFGGGASTASYAYYDSSNFVRAVNYGVDPNTATVAGGSALTTGSSNVQTTAAITAQGADTFNTIRIQNTANSAQAFTQTAGTTLTVNGILRAGNGGGSSTTTISGGILRAANNTDLVIRTDMSGDLLTISSTIQANGSNALVKSGAGTLTLSSSNSYTGGTYLNNGVLYVGNNFALGTGTFTINSGTLTGASGLSFSNNMVINGPVTTIPLNSGTYGGSSIRLGRPITWSHDSQGGGNNTVVSGTITDASGGNTLNLFDIGFSIVNTSNNIKFTAPVSLRGDQYFSVSVGHVTDSLDIAGSIGQDAPGYGLTIVGSNSFDGQWTKTLKFTGSNTYTGTTTIGPGVTLTLGDDGTTGSLHPSGTIVNNGRFVAQRSNVLAQGTNFGLIDGIGEVAVKAGTMSLSSANTFVGPINLYGGVMSFNSIQNAGVSSPIGAYGVAGPGGILFGNANGNSGTLRYTGTTASSNRGFTITHGSPTIDVSAAGTILTMGDSWIGGQTINITGGANSGLTVNSLQLTGAATLNPTSASLTVGSVIGSGGNGLTLGGTNLNNSVTGDINLAAATLTKSGNSKWTLGGQAVLGTASITSGTLAMTGAGSLVSTANVDITASGVGFDISGISASSLTVGPLSGVSGSILTLGGKNLAFGLMTSTTFAGSITGVGGSITKQGAGTATLSGSSTFSGTTRVAAGVLLVSNTFALQNSTLDVNAADSGNVSFGQNAIVGGLIGSRSLNLGTRTLSVGNNNASSSFSGVLTNGGLTKLGSGTMVLTGLNTYTGTTTISAGRVQIGDGGTAGSIASSAVITGSPGGSLVFNRSDNYGGAYGGVIGGSVQVVLSSGVLTLTGTNNYSGGTTISSGTLEIGNGGTTGSLSGNVTNNGTLVFNRSDSFSYGGMISGSGGLNKIGAGSFTLGGIGSSDYTGATTIAQGTLIVGVINAIPSSSQVTIGSAAGRGTLDVSSDVTLANVVFTGSGGNVVGSQPNQFATFQASSGTATITAISGSSQFGSGLFVSFVSPTVVDVAAGAILQFQSDLDGNASLTKAGAGAMELAGDNSFLTGDFFITGGRVDVGNGAAQLGTGTVTVSGGATLDLNSRAITNSITLVSGTIVNQGASTTTTITGASTISGSIAGIYDVDSGGAATFAGVAEAGSQISVQAGGSALFSATVAGTATISGSATFGSTSGLTGFLSAGSTGSVLLDNVASTISGGIHNDGTLTVDRGSGSQTISGEIEGTGNLVKQGAGKLLLTAANTFTGTTTVAQGTLVVNGGLSNAALDVAVGASLMGSGTIGGLTSIAGLHSPGNSPGIQTFTDLTYVGGTSSVIWELSGNTVTQSSPAVYDQIIVDGTLDFAGLTTLALSFDAAGSTVNWSDAFWNTDRTWTFYDVGVTGTTTNSTNFVLGGVPANWFDTQSTPQSLATARPDASFSVMRDGNDMLIIYAIVPEPAGIVIAGCGIALAAWAAGRRSRAGSRRWRTI